MANDIRKKYKAMLEAPEILVMPGVFDGFSTAIVEKMGFKAGFVSGAGISESALGLADFGVMGLEDNLNRAGPWWIFQAFRFRLTPIRVTAMR